MADCKRCFLGENDDCYPHVAEDKECDFFRPKTNADRIRSMGDIELGNFLSGLCNGCVNCPMYLNDEIDCVMHCNSSWHNWLKQETKEK